MCINKEGMLSHLRYILLTPGCSPIVQNMDVQNQSVPSQGQPPVINKSENGQKNQRFSLPTKIWRCSKIHIIVDMPSGYLYATCPDPFMIVLCRMSESIYFVSKNPFACYNSLITLAKIVHSVSFVLHPAQRRI